VQISSLKIVLLIVVLLFYGGCSKVMQSIADNVEYELVKIDVNMMQNSQNMLGAIFTGNLSKLSKVSVTPHIKLTNKNSVGFDIYKTEYKIFVDNKKIANGVSNASISLKANETKTMTMPIVIEMDKVASSAIDALMSQDMKRVKVLGKNYVKSAIGNIVVKFTMINGKVKIESIDSVKGEVK